MHEVLNAYLLIEELRRHSRAEIPLYFQSSDDEMAIPKQTMVGENGPELYEPSVVAEDRWVWGSARMWSVTDVVNVTIVWNNGNGIALIKPKRI